MKGAILSKSHVKTGSNIIYYYLISFLIKPFVSGLYGFAAFFTVLIFTKGITYLIGFTEQYIVSSDDVLFSILGFVLVFLIKLFDNIKHKAAG
jgi:biotin transporter BioY